MNLETLGIAIAILVGGGGILAAIIKWINKKIIDIATEVVSKSQAKCLEKREDCMSSVAERLDILEKTDLGMDSVLNDIKELKESDNNTKLVLVKIESNFSNLEQGQEKIELLISNLQGQFQETTGQLIKTIQSLTIKHE